MSDPYADPQWHTRPALERDLAAQVAKVNATLKEILTLLLVISKRLDNR